MISSSLLKSSAHNDYLHLLPQTAPKNIFAIASGKGGVGKTCFSITLCHALTQFGDKTLLFDGDIGLANADIQLGINPEHDLAEVFIHQKMLPAIITHHNKHLPFDLIAGRSGSGVLSNLTRQQFYHLRYSLMVLAKNYTNIFIDLGAGIDRNMRQLAASAGTQLLVTTEEPTSLTDAYALIKVSRKTNPEMDFKIIVNKVKNPEQGLKIFNSLSRACENFLNYKPGYLGSVQNDLHISKTIRMQTPLLTNFPQCEAAKDIKAIAKKIQKLIHNA